MSHEELNSLPQVPESPRRITEISFTSFASRLEKLEQSETRDEPREKGKIFWLRITRDVTKIHEMQNVFKYLRYAQAGPTIKRVKMRVFFNRWQKAMSGHKWVIVASKLRDKIRVNEFKDSANRITYVRSKLTKENYVKKHQFTPDFTFLSNYVTFNTVQPIKQLIPSEPLPEKNEYEYEEEYEEEEAREVRQEELPINQNKVPSSPQQSPARNQSQYSERAITIEQTKEEEEESEEITNEKLPPQTVETTEKKKSSSKLWIILTLLLIIGALVGAFAFFGKCKINGSPQSIESINEIPQDELLTTTDPTPVAEVTTEKVATETNLENVATENAATENVTVEDASNQTKEL